MSRSISNLCLAGVFSMLVALGSGSVLGAAEPCLPINSDVREMLADYIQKKYHLSGGARVRLVDEAAVGNTCYLRLRFESDGGAVPTAPLYLSPDRRFLLSDLQDITSDPLREERIINGDIAQRLERNALAYLGPIDAPVTIVVFSDFQCPYCKRAAELLKAEFATEAGKRIRVVFRHYPLAMHKWASAASEMAVCANFQSPGAFWALHDYFFENQKTLTLDNLGEKAQVLLRSIPGIDERLYRSCMDNSMSTGVVMRDTNLGRGLKVNGTPTLFVNGRRLMGISKLEDLHRAIIDALPASTGSDKAGK